MNSTVLVLLDLICDADRRRVLERFRDRLAVPCRRRLGSKYELALVSGGQFRAALAVRLDQWPLCVNGGQRA